jgi:hypothetical protein
MSEFERLPNPTGAPHTVTLYFFDDEAQVVAELLETLIKHQDTDFPVFRLEVGNAYRLEFLNTKIISVRSPGFGCGEGTTLNFKVTVEYLAVTRTTITK